MGRSSTTARTLMDVEDCANNRRSGHAGRSLRTPTQRDMRWYRRNEAACAGSTGSVDVFLAEIMCGGAECAGQGFAAKVATSKKQKQQEQESVYRTCSFMCT